MSERKPRKYNKNREVQPVHYGKKCQDCGYFSKTTFCAVEHRVLSGERDACLSFKFRRPIGRQPAPVSKRANRKKNTQNKISYPKKT
ncbi:MAG: hypothetical protein NTV15_04640 [Candidatus Bathyarchaeota archaeon]|nr:hypothetical protein [Candidatus Bathyarchaeota archaeon]